MQEYVDIVRDLIDDLQLDSYLYPDGDGYNDEVLVVESWDDARELNKALREAFLDMGIIEEDDEFDENDEWNTTYIDMALNDDGWVFMDESFTCDECGKAYRLDNSGYTSYANYFVDDYGIVCVDCVKANPEPYIESLINEPTKCNTILDPEDLEDAGFERIGDTYENGWYGRNDSPQEILDDILDRSPDAKVIFDVHKTGNPWATRFDTWVKDYDGDDDSEAIEEDEF